MAHPVQIKQAAYRWWHDLQGDPNNSDLNKRKPADRASLSRLRRSSITQAMAERATFDLFQRCQRTNPEDLPRLAAIAITLAHIREIPSTKAPTIRLVGQASFNDEESAKLKPIRFRRLLAARSNEELVEQMRRFIALAGHRGHPGELANDMFYWNERTRARWAFDYYNAGEHSTGNLPA